MIAISVCSQTCRPSEDDPKTKLSWACPPPPPRWWCHGTPKLCRCRELQATVAAPAAAQVSLCSSNSTWKERFSRSWHTSQTHRRHRHRPRRRRRWRRPRRARAVRDLPAVLHRQFRHSDTHFTYDIEIPKRHEISSKFFSSNSNTLNSKM